MIQMLMEKQVLTEKDVQDAEIISRVFSELSEENKTMALVYISALRDKELADSAKKKMRR